MAVEKNSLPVRVVYNLRNYTTTKEAILKI